MACLSGPKSSHRGLKAPDVRCKHWVIFSQQLADYTPGVHHSGGSKSKGASVLTRLHELRAAEDELARHAVALADAEKALKGL